MHGQPHAWNSAKEWELCVQCVFNARVHVESLLPSFPPTLPYWCQLMRQFLHGDTYVPEAIVADSHPLATI